MGSTVVRDRFSLDAAGAPIPGIPQECSIYESCQAALSDLDWAPFQSWHDWEVVKWAKLSSVTLIVVLKLLSILEVCPIFV